jgi:hypothetical protein
MAKAIAAPVAWRFAGCLAPGVSSGSAIASSYRAGRSQTPSPSSHHIVMDRDGRVTIVPFRDAG